MKHKVKSNWAWVPRSISILLCGLLTLSLIACNKNNSDQNKIQPIETPAETVLLVTNAETTPVATTSLAQADVSAETSQVVADPVRTGKVYLYLTVNVVDKDQLNQVFVYIENQSNRKFQAAEAMRLEELVDGSWQKIAEIKDKSSYVVNMNDLSQQILNLSSYDLAGPGRQFRFYQKYKLLNSQGDAEFNEEVYSQNFTIHSQAVLTGDEYVAVGLDKTEFTQAELAQFNLYVDNASSKYVMVFRNFSIQVYSEGKWKDYPINLDFSLADSWYINPDSRDKQSYNLRQAGLDPSQEAYRIVKPYGLFETTDSSQESESFVAFSEPFKILP